MELLRGAVRPYAWGSRTTIAAMLGNPTPAPHPEAELWIGAHPGDPATVVTRDERSSLLELIDAAPREQLGAECADRWQERLPFLLKILAVEEPLSMQAHPSADQAAVGWKREEAAGIPRGASNRNYPDPTAKPELVCALSEFHALAGFRDPHSTVELLRTIETPGLTQYTDLLAAQPDADGLRALFTTWITLPQPALDALLPEVLDACVWHVKDHGEYDSECRTVLELGERHPGDAAVLAALLLNRITLSEGEGIYLPAGYPHLYLSGTAVEVLANSDNILRCGLTPKHVDVPELLRVLDFGCGPTPVLHGERDEAAAVYRTSADEFELSRLEWDVADPMVAELDSRGPQIVLCTRGGVTAVPKEGEPVLFRQGEALWIPAGDPPTTLHAPDDQPSTVFRATAGVI